MAKSSRKRKQAKARKGKAPSKKSAKTPTSQATQAPAAKAKTQAPRKKPAAAAKTTKAPASKSAAKKQSKPAAAAKTTKAPASKSAAKKQSKPAKSGFFLRLKNAFAAESPKEPVRVTPSNPTLSRSWSTDPDIDRFAALDPANRTKTKLPPRIERPRPLHLEEAPPRKPAPEESDRRILLENPVVEPREGGEPVRLRPEETSETEEKPYKLTAALLADNVTQAMRRNSGATEADPADPFVLGLDDNFSATEPGAKNGKAKS